MQVGFPGSNLSAILESQVGLETQPPNEGLYVMSFCNLGRRSFLKAAGISIALPAFESLPRVFGAAKQPPRRMVCIGNEFGMYPGAFWPQKFGSKYELTTLLQPLASTVSGGGCPLVNCPWWLRSPERGKRPLGRKPGDTTFWRT